jgi:hypothetical protein
MRTKIIVSSLVMLLLLWGCSEEDSDSGTNPVDAPDTPTGLAVTGTGLTSLTLSWDVVDDATAYKLYRSETELGSYSEVYSGAAAGYQDDGLVYATTYYYEVSASNSGGESDPSATVNGTTDIPDGFTVTGSPSGAVDYTFNYYDDFNGKPRYQSDPIGLWIVVPTGGDEAGLWVFYDQIEGMNLYYHQTASDYPPPTGWRTVLGDTETSILLTPFAN